MEYSCLTNIKFIYFAVTMKWQYCLLIVSNVNLCYFTNIKNNHIWEFHWVLIGHGLLWHLLHNSFKKNPVSHLKQSKKKKKNSLINKLMHFKEKKYSYTYFLYQAEKTHNHTPAEFLFLSFTKLRWAWLLCNLLIIKHTSFYEEQQNKFHQKHLS